MPTINPFDILLVEDNSADAALTIRALKKHGLGKRLKWVQDGEQALDFLFARGKYQDRNKAELPKLILLDLNLPKIGGLELLETIRLDQQLQSIVVIVLTASKEHSDRLRSERLGVNGYLVKPVGEDSFITVVKQVALHSYFFDTLL